MKKLLYFTAILITLVSFTGCYADEAVVYGPPPRRVFVGPSPYYRPAPVIVESYGGRGYYRGRGWHRGHSRGYGRY